MVSEEVRARVVDDFGSEYASNVIDELNRYGSSSYHREVDRVHKTILSVAKGDRLRVRVLVDVAINDYRDILIADSGSRNPNRINKVVYLVVTIVLLCMFVLAKF